MKYLISILLILSLKISIQACTCFGPAFCELSQAIDGDERELIFMGTYLRSDTLTFAKTAMQFKVDRLYRGDIVTASSPLYAGESYENTDSTVWIVSGPEPSCLRWIADGRAIFALIYNDRFASTEDEPKYVPTICRGDYFPIDSGNMVSGAIWELSERPSMSLSDFEELILDECRASNSFKEAQYAEQTLVYPSPTFDILTIYFQNGESDWNIDLYDMTGEYVLSVATNSIDLSYLPRGIYLLVFTKDRFRFSKKIVKV